jgi:hypothetical protein
MCEMDNNSHKDAQREDVNCAPLSDVMKAGTPKRWIQPLNKAAAQSAAEIPGIEIASGQRVVLSTTVKR